MVVDVSGIDAFKALATNISTWRGALIHFDYPAKDLNFSEKDSI